ncbi:2-C-methyl-D-erythritol 2,4-cyclodiphosphate synthase [Brachyspira hampsonii]|uniref:2-C-methyl-D-erythritol 2,4-cyclodiphosphate synthase n=1 Tax=Brachyspira hampsonii 30446 TaxID=1289135 RepID=A0A2U4F4W9_9SPIR|nr:2-C-methyl-D-erythritol 2,4-cyclodiphosphate synthase [Brachyspira hampsonii]EKV57697.1 2-C-methyl-D-erythritol 2,4-cyclo diphosphate synthase [Brachyspira hampsonii 30446]MBW5389909.1 2-C-methyl-D-erythritol 2,4-cyclodiphosphate synthase [Brachyspira hampsonii]MBW5393620.1 2-C-methyl-D-erythritol 2,4-cyclodiphosphate synthase [Brachyspira hampsonii]OEJ20609.1 2-C-methyl-D-erythritol 2,4-cyclodiphosphate synthase [Brachyspira hampsonii]
MRIGYGYDSHVFADNRKLILSGIEIPYELGLKGHSDADAVIHALIDSILGALALGDIGSHFPDNDEQYKDISSIVLLEKTVLIMQEKNYEISNTDITIILEKPKLRKYIDTMRENLSKILKTDIENISIKAKTNEKMDSIGRGEGIAVHCVSLLKKTK